MKHFLKGIGLAVLTLAIPRISGAEEDTLKTYYLDEVVVTATKFEEKVRLTTVHVDVITEKEIENLGALTVGDIVGKMVTGHYHNCQSLLQPIGLRGFRTELLGDDIKGYVLILVDGHRIGTGNMAKIPPDMIDRIEVIKGPASALYGAAAMGGVVNIITKKGEGKIKTTIKQNFGSFKYKKTSLMSGGRINNWVGYQIAANYEDRDNLQTEKYGEVYNSKEQHKIVSGNLLFYPSDGHDVRLGFSYADLLGHYPSWKDSISYDPETKSYSDKSRAHADLEYNGSFMDDKIHWKAIGYYLWDHNDWNYGDSIPENDASIYDDDTRGIDQQLTLKFIPYNKLIFGVTYEELKKESEGRKDNEPSRPYTPGMRYKTNSFYAQDVINLLDERLNIIAGARYDKFDLTTKRPKTGEFDSFNERTESFDHISPRGGIAYNPSNILRVRVNISEGFKSPSADELSAMYEYTSWGTPNRILGNPDLKPETITSYEFGFDIAPEPVIFGVTWFHTNLRDKIVKAKELVEYEGKEWQTFENLGKAEIEGIELYYKCRVGELLSWTFGDIDLSSNLALNTWYKDMETGEKLLYISDYELKTNLRLSYKKATVGISYVLVGPQQIQNYDTWPATIEEKDCFGFWDIIVRYEILKGLNLETTVYNLLNLDYEWARGYPMPQRNFKVGISYIF